MRYRSVIAVGAACVLTYAVLVIWRYSDGSAGGRGTVTVCDAGVCVPVVAMRGAVGDILRTAGVPLTDGDRVWPVADAVVGHGGTITVDRRRRIVLIEDRQQREVESSASTVGDILSDVGVTIGDDDEMTPERQATVGPGGTITVNHVIVREEKRTVRIPFDTEEREDADRRWGTVIVISSGSAGSAEVTERVVIKGGKEVRRTETSRTVVTKPEPRVVVTGTKVTLGKKHTGQSSWYAYRGCDCAANPWLPKGSYAKVTNNANGKSVIVRINDRGPFVPGRIIDLDKVAFAKIASLGAGVIDVTMEEVK